MTERTGNGLMIAVLGLVTAIKNAIYLARELEKTIADIQSVRPDLSRRAIMDYVGNVSNRSLASQGEILIHCKNMAFRGESMPWECVRSGIERTGTG